MINIQRIPLPFQFTNGKSKILLDIFNSKTPVPIKELKRKHGKSKYYSFLEEIKKLNDFLKSNFPSFFPIIKTSLGKDSLTGQEVKVAQGIEHVEVEQKHGLTVLYLISDDISPI